MLSFNKIRDKYIEKYPHLKNCYQLRPFIQNALRLPVPKDVTGNELNYLSILLNTSDRDISNITPFAELITVARIKKGMTQKEVATALGVGFRTYQSWEYGERLASGKYMLRLINILELDMETVNNTIEKI